MQTYTNKSNARRAARKAKTALNHDTDFEIFTAPDGRYGFKFVVPQPVKKSGRRGGWKFGEGKGAKLAKLRDPETTSAGKVHVIFAWLNQKLGTKVPPRAFVVAMADMIGIKKSQANAEYTVYKHAHNLNIRAGRPTEEQWDIFENVLNSGEFPA